MVFITGATGLLGSHLVSEFIENGVHVIAQFHKRVPGEKNGCTWLKGDFSSLEKVRAFIKSNIKLLDSCSILVNNYGPMTWKELGGLTSEDLIHDFSHNLIVSWEFMKFFVEKENSEVIANVGFEFAGENKIYKKILPYAISKNSLLTLTNSCKSRFPRIRFLYLKTPELIGAEFERKNSHKVDPAIYSKKLVKEVLANLEK